MRRFDDYLAEKLRDPEFAAEFWRAEADESLRATARLLALRVPSFAIVRLDSPAEAQNETGDSVPTTRPQVRPSAN